jgi:hypothetical protein
MIFARFFFPHQVGKRLGAMGWRRRDMPAKVMFNDLCRALQASGYDADAAANLWNRCLQYEPEGIEQLKRDTGFYGILHLSQFFDKPDDMSAPDKQLKRRGTAKSKKR